LGPPFKATKTGSRILAAASTSSIGVCGTGMGDAIKSLDHSFKCLDNISPRNNMRISRKSNSKKKKNRKEHNGTIMSTYLKIHLFGNHCGLGQRIFIIYPSCIDRVHVNEIVSIQLSGCGSEVKG
jgi:hypothetical protein